MISGSGRVATVMRVVDLVAAHEGVTVRWLAEQAGLSRSAAHRIVVELETTGHVVRAAGGRGYLPGPAAVGSGSPPMRAEERFRLRPVVHDVRESTGESVHTAILVGDHVLVVDGRRSAHRVDIGLRIGMTAPANAMAAGKLLLAPLADQVVASLFPHDPLPRRSRWTVSSRSDLLAALSEIRREGVARAVQESEPGVASVAVPLHGASWRDRVALVVSVPIERAGGHRLIELERSAVSVVADHASRGTVRPWSTRRR